VKLKFTDDFKEGYLKVIDILPRPSRFYKNLWKITRLFEQGYKTPPGFTVNSIKGHKHWYNCYVYRDARYIIILQYIVENENVILLRIGPIEDFVEFKLNN
jgi:hypothetical protein